MKGTPFYYQICPGPADPISGLLPLRNFFAPNLRIFEKNHKFGAYADIQCIGKLAEILSDLLTAVVEYHPVPKRATGTNSLPRHQLCDFPSCEKDLRTRIKIMLYP